MLFHGQGQDQDQEASPDVIDYIFHGLFGLFFTFIAVSVIAALFNNRMLARFHWGKGRGGAPMSRFSIVMSLPLPLFVSLRYIVAIVAILTKQKMWDIPYWWFFICIGMFVLAAALDELRKRWSL
jgi:hypothetical protein